MTSFSDNSESSFLMIAAVDHDLVARAGYPGGKAPDALRRFAAGADLAVVDRVFSANVYRRQIRHDDIRAVP